MFAEWHRVLKVGGLLMFSCFGPDTLQELRAAFAEVDLAPHTLPFVDMHDFGDQLVEAGFAEPVMDMEKITVTYDHADKLLADARALAATRAVAPQGSAGQRRLRAPESRTGETAPGRRQAGAHV